MSAHFAALETNVSVCFNHLDSYFNLLHILRISSYCNTTYRLNVELVNWLKSLQIGQPWRIFFWIMFENLEFIIIIMLLFYSKAHAVTIIIR